mmetsp:Transcript_2227/g.5102  ORF Transcript_2227/g.5102 Transcript_2227/m.5102 type:complete len:336 (-) Transcript_2227:85-1092(-)
MFAPSSFGASLVVALVSMCCWGSWSNTLKATQGLVRFEVFYLDFAFSTFATSLIAALTLGMISSSREVGRGTFADDFHGKSLERYVFAFAAGLVFNVANLCLCKGIGMLGLALAFPICIGTALVLGTAVTYAVQPQGNVGLLVLGVLLAFAAVCQAAIAQRLRERQITGDSVPSRLRSGGVGVPGEAVAKPLPAKAQDHLVAEEASPQEVHVTEPPFLRKLAVCLLGGVLMGLWNPLVTLAEKDSGLSAYGEMTFYTLAVFVSTMALVPGILRWPLEGGVPVPLAMVALEYRTTSARCHACGLQRTHPLTGVGCLAASSGASGHSQTHWPATRGR